MCIILDVLSHIKHQHLWQSSIICIPFQLCPAIYTVRCLVCSFACSYIELIIFKITSSCSPSQHEEFFNSFIGLDGDTTQVILDKVDWADDTVSMIQQLTNSAGTSYCLDSNVSFQNWCSITAYIYIVITLGACMRKAYSSLFVVCLSIRSKY